VHDYPKRLIEIDLPIARISAHARREKSSRHSHISMLPIWWARRPLAACRVLDNVFVERFLWRTVKYEEVYLKDYETPRAATMGLA